MENAFFIASSILIVTGIEKNIPGINHF